jgi:hypothetical protein
MAAPDHLPRSLAQGLLALALASEASWSQEQFFEAGGKYHSKEMCEASRKAGSPEHCFIHNPSTHHMRDWPIVVRASTLIERVCPHGVGHPDPDSAAYLNWRDGHDAWGIHGCDGCCFRKD